MATIIYVPPEGRHSLSSGISMLLRALRGKGHTVVVIDLNNVESFRDPVATSALKEYELVPKKDDVFFMGDLSGADSAFSAATYLTKEGETQVSGVILIDPTVPFLVAPVKYTFLTVKKVFGIVFSGEPLWGSAMQHALLYTPLVLRKCRYPVLHFYSNSEASEQKKLGQKLLLSSFSTSHPVGSSEYNSFDSCQYDVVIERTVSWIDAIVLSNQPEEEKVGMTSEAS